MLQRWLAFPVLAIGLSAQQLPERGIQLREQGEATPGSGA
jgi:hypothetical protein